MENEIAKTDSNGAVIADEQSIKDKIYTIRGVQVMLDSDLAEVYGYEVKRLNEQVKRNAERFPANFMFRLTREEIAQNLRSQIVTLEQGKYSKYLPYAFTEQGVVMLASVLRTPRAVEISVRIVEAFVEMTHYMNQSRQIAPSHEIYLLSRCQDAIETDVEEEVLEGIRSQFVTLEQGKYSKYLPYAFAVQGAVMLAPNL
jgi:phage regulator Rha-like protein